MLWSRPLMPRNSQNLRWVAAPCYVFIVPPPSQYNLGHQRVYSCFLPFPTRPEKNRDLCPLGFQGILGSTNPIFSPSHLLVSFYAPQMMGNWFISSQTDQLISHIFPQLAYCRGINWCLNDQRASVSLQHTVTLVHQSYQWVHLSSVQVQNWHLSEVSKIPTNKVGKWNWIF